MENKKILIIGGSGALGKTLIKRYQEKNKIKIFSRDEHKQFYLISSGWVNSNVTFTIGDIKEKSTILNTIEDFKPDVIINAAALKHVPLCEINPYESVKTNIIGNQNLIEAVKESSHKIECIFYISTDKACKPFNIYGMCKAISERLYIEFSKKRDDLKVCVVRYGNVLESTGSVIPFFKKIIQNGSEDLPITDERMTRFLLTLDDAVDLINWAYHSENSGGKIAVPKVNSFKIVDIAKSLIRNYLGSDNAIPLRLIGVRKGEKIHEEMISGEEWMRTIDGENYLIGDEVVRDDVMSYNSSIGVMEYEMVFNFLREKGVI